MKSSVVIYAAGKGSRFKNLPEGYSKCAIHIPLSTTRKNVYITPVTGTMNAFLSRGVSDFHIVVGNCKESVMEEVSKLVDAYVKNYGETAVTCKFINNDKWDFHGCEYSVNLGLKSAIESGAEVIYVVEGDTIVAPEIVGRLVDVEDHNAMLVKSGKGDPKKSVIGYAGSIEGITKFWYDQSHSAESYPEYEGMKPFVSGQIWKILVNKDRKDQSVVSDIVNTYFDNISNEIPELSAGLVSLEKIASISEPFFPVYTSDEGVFNINTEEDLKSFLEFIAPSKK